MASKIDPFRHLLGKVPDEKIAEIADLATSTVETYRREAGIDAPPDEEEAKGGEVASEASASSERESVATPPAPSSPPRRRRRRRSAPRGAAAVEPDVQAAAKAMLEDGWALEGGRLVPPMEAREQVIRLKRAVPVVGRGKSNRFVSIVLARSVYRGPMAARVMGLVQDKSLIELLG